MRKTARNGTERSRKPGADKSVEEKASQQSITTFFSKESSASQLFSTIGSGKKNKKNLKLKKGRAQGTSCESDTKTGKEANQNSSEKRPKISTVFLTDEGTSRFEGLLLFSSDTNGCETPKDISKQGVVTRNSVSGEFFKTPGNPGKVIEKTSTAEESDDDIIPPTPSPGACRSLLSSKSLQRQGIGKTITKQADDVSYTKLRAARNGKVAKKKPLSPKNGNDSILPPQDPQKESPKSKLSFAKRKAEVVHRSASDCRSSISTSNTSSNIDVNMNKSVQTNKAMQNSTGKKSQLSRQTSKPSVDVGPGQSLEKNSVNIASESIIGSGDKVATPLLAPRKIVMAKSKAKSLKRRASKGNSPLNKRHQSDAMSFNTKETVKANLFDDPKPSARSPLKPSSPDLDMDIAQAYGVSFVPDGNTHVKSLFGLSREKDRTSPENHQHTAKGQSPGSTEKDSSISEKENGKLITSLGDSGSLLSRRQGELTPPKYIKLNFTSNKNNETKTPNKKCGSAGYDRHAITNMALMTPTKTPTKHLLNTSRGSLKTPSKCLLDISWESLQTPTKDLLDTSSDSLMDVELGGLLDGVEWSPVGKDTPIRKPQDPSTEPPVTYSPHTTPYLRYLVLEVYRQEVSGKGDIARYGRSLSEKVLRVFDESQGQERYCFLRQDWENTEVEPGDIVHVTGEFDSITGVCILDNTTDHYILVHPDTLVSGTTVAGATSCLRRSILNERFRTENTNEAMLMGTLLHDLFDKAMQSKDFSKEGLLAIAQQLLQQQSYLEGFYGLGMTETAALDKVKELLPAFSEWARRFVRSHPDPDLNLMEYKDASGADSADQPSVCVSELRDIEENVWSPRFGLKGKVDATVEVTIDRRPRMKRHRADTQNQHTKAVVPLELKTGKLFSKLGSVEHRAQVILYTLLLCDRYRHAVDTGLLYYMRSGHALGVPALVHEKRALIMRRNEVARYLTLNRTSGGRNMPGMLQDPHTCSRCSQAQNCSVFHKSVENGTHVTSGMGELFNELTNHLTAAHTEFFADWFKLVCLEGKEMLQSGKSSQHKIWTMEAWDREQLGQCFSGMVLSSSEALAGGHGKYTHRFERSADHPSQSPLVDVSITSGDRVVVSEEQCNLVAVAAGYVRDVLDEVVEIILDRNLANCTRGTPYEGSQLVFRIDKDEGYSSLTTLWSNVAKLFNKASERDAQLRRMIIDLEPPVFARSRQALLNFSSQSSVGSTQNQIGNESSQELSTPKYRDTTVEAITQGLNSDQRRAISKALCAEDYALILGMPGTGKTTTISCLVRVLVNSSKSVLLTSYTHTAVDNILLKLKEEGVDFLRLGQVQKVLPAIQPYTVSIAGANIKRVNELKEFYDSKAVVATTCLGVNHALFSQRSFDYCIVDEASQITQPVCLGPLRHARVFVLVGDHYQLPPLVQSLQAREGGMDASLFKRLSERHPQAVVSLEHQYRMHKNIMALSNTLIYGDRLKCGTSKVAESLLDIPRWDKLVDWLGSNCGSEQGNWLIRALDPRSPVVFLNTDAVPAREVRSGRLVSNEREAILVQHVTCALRRGGVAAGAIGIISPYRHQLKLIRQLLSGNTQDSREELEINTVDKYQGRDKPCILVSLVRSNDSANVGDLLKDWRRVNVAVTRAKRKLILIGSLTTLKASLLLHELLDLLVERDWVQELPKDAHIRNEDLTNGLTESQDL